MGEDEVVHYIGFFAVCNCVGCCQNSSADFLESWQAYLDSLPADLAAEVTNKVEEKPAGDLIRGKRALRRTGNAAIGTRSSLVNARKFFAETSAKLHALETEFGRSL